MPDPERPSAGSTEPRPTRPATDPSAATKRRRWPWILAAVLAVLWVESLLPPRQQPTARALVTTIHLYQALISPRLEDSGVQCRFEPSCSHYGEAVIRRFGTVRGVGLTARRILRCGPWTEAGTADPPPFPP